MKLFTKFHIIKFHIIFQIVLLLAVFFSLYAHAVATLVADWSVDPNFSHGFFIPPIALYMVWVKRKSLTSMTPAPSNQGLGLICLGMMIHLTGHIGAELFLMRFSMVTTLAGMVLYFWGWKVLRALTLPISYLVLMIPLPTILWNKVAFPLQLLAAQLSAGVIQFIDIPVFREGNILQLANTTLEVVDACSGLRSLTSLIALTGLFAYMAPLTLFKKWVLFFSAIPIAVAVNVIRLTLTAAMAYWISPAMAHGFLHDMSGMIIFVGALALVYLVFYCEMRLERWQGK